MRINDLKGKKFGRLLVIDRDFNNEHKGVYWNCICDCGKRCSVLSCALITGHTKSCGCLMREKAIERLSKGNRDTKEYVIWKGMRERCNNKKASNYHWYGERRIKVCEEWNNFDNFYNWCKISGYKKGLSIDRIDNNGNYSPENCRWVNKIVQGSNKRNNVKVEYNGKLFTLMDLERMTGIDHRTLGYRLKSGWTVAQIINIPPKYGNKINSYRYDI